MDFKELGEFIDTEDRRLIERFGDLMPTQQEKILARTVKLTEELGELCNEVLAFNGDQRKEKLHNHNTDTLSEEFADVIIVALLLAKTMDVNVEEALRKKIEKIHRRYE